jgi:hypothetical protein
MTFDQWLNEIEGFSLRQERAISDIRNCVAKGKTDDIIKWLMAAYAMGHEQGYDVGYYDANEECKEKFDEYRMGDDF